jgi:hypothetical protein
MELVSFSVAFNLYAAKLVSHGWMDGFTLDAPH